MALKIAQWQWQMTTQGGAKEQGHLNHTLVERAQSSTKSKDPNHIPMKDVKFLIGSLVKCIVQVHRLW